MDSPAVMARVVGALLRARDRREPVGFDTEFFGVDIGNQSCVGLARVHLLSVAVKRDPRVVLPRGYDLADAAVLPATCLEDASFRDWLADENAEKVVHNAPVDVHACLNSGAVVRGFVNSLALSRWAWPNRARGAGFTLDSLGRDLLGVGKTESFKELFQEEYESYWSTWKKVRRCECGANPCRKRQNTPGHNRIEEEVETVHSKLKTREVPLEEVVPGHRLWERALKYSAQDAVLALGVYDLALRAMEVEREIPWMKP